MGKPNRTKKRQSTASSNNAAQKKRKPTLAQHRKKRKELAEEKEKEQGARLVVEEYFEVEKIVGERKRDGRKEYRVRWKGLPPSDDTWEPKSSLCDTAYTEALRFSREQQAGKLNSIKEGERALGFCHDSSIQETKAPSNRPGAPTAAMGASDRVAEASRNFVEESTNFAKAPNALVEHSSNVARSPSRASKVFDVEYFPIPGTEIIIPKDSPKEATDNQWQQADQDQLVFRDVERIDVNDKDAKDRVRELRVNGIPFVLMGHSGWAQFASRWLKRPRSNRPKQDEKPLDLSVPQQVDVDRMMHDIGDEEVPILKKDYNEYKPIAGKLLANTFIEHCWPKDGKLRGDNSEKTGLQTHAHMFYLHQWQFPLSETAKGNLCGRGRSIPLPNDVMGEDLLQFYLEDLQDNPFQYIFMGHEGTMSKLHSDNGGLEVSIAPIVGEKECVLVHRSDGESCLYDLDARIDDINLQKFPMLAFARVWKTVVRPGEILWMPQGTFHQCRNITPCLSYSRFHLDTVNLHPFLESLFKGDAPEIEHDLVVWNAAHELMNRVDKYVAQIRADQKHQTHVKKDVPPPAVVQAVETARLLRHVSREIVIRLQQHRHPGSRRRLPKESSLFDTKDEDALRSWPNVVRDIDQTIHEFEYRHVTPLPKFQVRGERKTGSSVSSSEKQDATGILMKLQMRSVQNTRPVNQDTALFESSFEELPKVQEGGTIPDSIKLGVNDTVFVRFHGKRVRGSILQIVDQMRAFGVSYEEFPSFYDEFRPETEVELLQEVPGSGEPSSSNSVDEGGDRMTTHQVVRCRVGGKGEKYRAIIQNSRYTTFYLMRLFLGNYKCYRWLCRDSIIERVVSTVPATATVPAYDIPSLDEASSQSDSRSDDNYWNASRRSFVCDFEARL